MDRTERIDFDRKHLWHPYTSMDNPLPCFEVEKAYGSTIELSDGTRLIDGMSSWWAAIHGYNHPKIRKAIEAQIQKMSHIMFGGLTHRPAVELGQRLIEILPQGLEKIFYCDSGSVAVEVAIKMALQYWFARGEESKVQLATVRSGYHGDTWHAMSVCDPQNGMHSLYHGRLPIHHFVNRCSCSFYDCWDDRYLDEVRELFEREHKTLAAFILEPIVQGAGGMWFYHPMFLKGVRKLCNQYHVLLIADEIATGFGRTGKLWAVDWAQIVPDIFCIGKALTGGNMSFAATITTSDVAQTISSGTPSEFMHGPTFMGNPLACAVANASIEMLLSSPWESTLKRVEKELKEGLAPLSKEPFVKEIRCLGAIGVVELVSPVHLPTIQKQFVEAGIWVRPFGKLVYVMPPYIITSKELQTLCRKMVEVVCTHFCNKREI